MKNKRRGQVALEFLMTYGWAFLIILVVIGAFIYFDVFNIGAPEMCRFDTGFTCEDQIAREGPGEVRVLARNSLGNAINVDDVELIYFDGATEVTVDVEDLSGVLTGPANDVWSHNQIIELVFDLADGQLIAGERFMGDIIVTFTPVGSDYERTRRASLSLPIEE